MSCTLYCVNCIYFRLWFVYIYYACTCFILICLIIKKYKQLQMNSTWLFYLFQTVKLNTLNDESMNYCDTTSLSRTVSSVCMLSG